MNERTQKADHRDVDVLLMIERYFVDALSDDERLQLESALLADRQLRDRFRAAASMDATLRYRAGDELSTPNQAEHHPGQRMRALLFLAIAASVLLAVLIGRSAWLHDERMNFVATEADDSFSNSEQSPLQRESRGLARLVIQNDLRMSWSDGSGDVPATFSADTYDVTQGEGTLRLRSGVEITLSAPAKFRLVDSMHVDWLAGRARAIVPPSGHGFRIRTPQGEIEDLGTEFGVSVSEEDQKSEVHVFAGEVLLHNDDNPPRSIREDMAIQLIDGKSQALPATSGDSFMTRGQIGFRRWQSASRKRRDDPTAILYYDFETDDSDPRRLVDRSSRARFDGRIVGGISASGRWPQKSALLLERPGDRIELTIPGEYEAVTMLAWVQINRFDQPVQTLFNTLDWNEGEHHFNLLRSGAIRVGIRHDYTLTGDDHPVPTGAWTHLAFVISQTDAVYYINGVQVLRKERDHPSPLRFGDCSIGAFGISDIDASGNSGTLFSRELRGRIDEFALFARPFSADEIRKTFNDNLER